MRGGLHLMTGPMETGGGSVFCRVLHTGEDDLRLAGAPRRITARHIMD